MRRRVGAILGWVAATLVSVLVASAAVATVQDQVTERPSPLHPAALDRLASSTTSVTATTAAAQPVTSTDDVPRASSSTTSTSATTAAPASTAAVDTSEAPSSSTSVATTTTMPETTTTTSTTAAPTTTGDPGELETYETGGGWVNILVYEEAVVLHSWTVASGYEIDIESEGPPKVELKFKSPSMTWSFKAKIDDGELDVQINEEGGGGDD